MKQAMKGSELIISPDGTLYHINLSRKNGFPPRFLLVGDPKRVETAERFLDGGKAVDRRENREFVSIWGRYKGEPVAIMGERGLRRKGLPVAVMGTGIGTDNTEIAVTELHAVHEFEPRTGVWEAPKEPLTLIRAGTSGSPQTDMEVGTLAITKHAIGLDSTGLFYLHKPLGDYGCFMDAAFYTPGNQDAMIIWHELRSLLTPQSLQVIRPYVSTATPEVVAALESSAKELVARHESIGYETGITTSAPGFFGPQGRSVGRLGNILLPDLQERLAELVVFGMRAINNEMESSVLNRLAGEILGYRVGSICTVVANRAKGQFASLDEYARSVDAALKAGFEALLKLG